MGFSIKLIVRFRELERRSLRLLGGRSERDAEYDFAYRHVTGRGLHIIDIGGCDSLLPLILARKGHRVTVYDFRLYPEKHPNLAVIRGDFLRNNLPANSFDIVMLISTIEHIGMGAYGAPEYPEADVKVMEEVNRILKEDGRAILTVPFDAREKVIPGFEKWYTPDRLKRLFQGWYILDAEFWVAEKKLLGRWVKWRPARMREAAQASERCGIHGTACFCLSKHPVEWWER